MSCKASVLIQTSITSVFTSMTCTGKSWFKKEKKTRDIHVSCQVWSYQSFWLEMR